MPKNNLLITGHANILQLKFSKSPSKTRLNSSQIEMSTNLILLNPDGTTSNEVFILIGPFSLRNESRNFTDLIKFLKVTKGVKGNISFFMDNEKTKELTQENYPQNKNGLVGGDIYYTIAI
jgi:hypothetical protein